MLTEQIYNLTNQCLNEIKTANIDHISQLRLEYLFIRLKRHIISLPEGSLNGLATANMKNLSKMREISQQINHAGNKEKSIAKLEKLIISTTKSLETAVIEK